VLFAWLVVDFWLVLREVGALVALLPFLEIATLFVHSPSGAGAAKPGCPFIDDLGCNDVLDECA
jgi:hypothetical protein